MTAKEKYDINLKMAQLTGWPYDGKTEEIKVLVIGDRWHDWNPWQNESQCLLVRDRLIELGRMPRITLIYEEVFMGCQIKENRHHCQLAITDRYFCGSTPSEAMCRAFAQLEVV